ncbi:MAG TPA: LacI family DNA-binding transcriptional regulator [Pseudonocardiaceae bacterium]|nr:LacI family DNA-binding transcriptional regulator [Pseudonocardiaceae bacterium]
MPVTIRDVAREAKVSVATVSRALSSPHQVNQVTRERVLAIADRFGYRPSPAARSLITGKTGNIGLVMPDLANPFFTGVLKNVQARAHQSGYGVFIGDSDEDPAVEEELVRSMAKQVDGVLLCSPGIKDSQITALAANTTLVLLNRRVRGISAALMDSAGGMRQSIEHLSALGHRRIAFLSGPRNSWSNKQRLRGLRAAVEQTGVEVHTLGPFAPRYSGGVQAADLALAENVTAIIAYNDIMALGVLARMHERDIDVPNELSLTSFDDLVYAAVSAPTLTTVAMPVDAAGRLAVDLLLSRLADPGSPVVHQELPTRLIVRGTTGPPPK